MVFLLSPCPLQYLTVYAAYSCDDEMINAYKGTLRLLWSDPGSSNHVDVSGWMSRASSVDGWGFWVGWGQEGVVSQPHLE